MRNPKFRIMRYKASSKTQRFLIWCQGWAELLDGLVTLLSFGFLCSNFELELSFWRAKVEIERMKKSHNS